MLNIENLEDKEYIMSNLQEVHLLFKATEQALELIKNEYKSQKKSYEDDNKKIMYSSYNRFVPENMEQLMKKYPIDRFPDVYTIGISAKASEIIMEEDLLIQVPVEKVVFRFK